MADDDVPEPSPEEAALGAAVDEALAAEVQRQQKHRFMQELMRLDRGEGVGRDDGLRNDSVYRDLDPDRWDDRED